MPISKIFKTVVSTKRISLVDGSKKRTFATNISALRCHIQPVSFEKQMPTSGAFYTSFKMWCAVGIDIADGDQVIEGSNVYVVKGVGSRNFGRGSGNGHLEIILVKTV